MNAPLLSCSNRLRRTPFSRRVEAAGVKAYTTYNHMLLPTVFRTVEEDYAHLKSAVQIWDVSCERQVEVVGPDARRLVQMTTPRDLARMADDQCYYIPMVDEHGRMLNDPVLNKLADERYWISLSDTDMLYYCKGLANGFGLDVDVFEPDVSPLAIQGPKADELIRRAFGQDIVDTRFFRHKTINVQGRDMIIARSGWSLQGGFELYLDGSEHGEAVWDMLFEAGAGLDVHAGCPNHIERIEGGLLSFGSDISMEHTPFEAGLGKYCNLQTATDCLGHAALLAAVNPARQIRPVEINGDAVPRLTQLWPLRNASGASVGNVSSAAWSPDFNTNVAIATVDKGHWSEGTELVVDAPDLERSVRVREKFWI
ncbi:MAG: dimethylsulfoniopropionate demethylase [Hyphomicrobiales bacterium]|nr:dimethylsulfoniopropionate demethylase [Hyphomicrobiales bacterium]